MKLSRKLIYLLSPLIGGLVVGLLIKDYIDYDSLINPPLSPKAYIFPIAWSILYILIGIAYYLYRKRNNNILAIKLYYGQLIFNYLWSIIFFIWKWRTFAIFWIISLGLIIIWLMYRFFCEEKVCYYLFIPYILWVIFATYLNIGIVFLN